MLEYKLKHDTIENRIKNQKNQYNGI